MSLWRKSHLSVAFDCFFGQFTVENVSKRKLLSFLNRSFLIQKLISVFPNSVHVFLVSKHESEVEDSLPSSTFIWDTGKSWCWCCSRGELLSVICQLVKSWNWQLPDSGSSSCISPQQNKPCGICMAAMRSSWLIIQVWYQKVQDDDIELHVVAAQRNIIKFFSCWCCL